MGCGWFEVLQGGGQWHEASGRDEAFAVPVNADSNLMCSPPASMVTSNINYEQLSNMMQNIGQNRNRKLQICI